MWLALLRSEGVPAIYHYGHCGYVKYGRSAEGTEGFQAQWRGLGSVTLVVVVGDGVCTKHHGAQVLCPALSLL
jgi:hypothetical protein